MGEHTPVEIHCPGCDRDTLLLREPQYEGFTRVGETLACASCGHIFDSEEEIPFRQARIAEVFTEADRSLEPQVFEDGEADRLCRYCRHYVVNPFMQWCGRLRKEVEATDTCPHFEPASEDGSSDKPAASPL